MKTIFMLVVLALMVAGCVVSQSQLPPFTPLILDGSKADAMLTYGYDGPPGRAIDWDSARPSAQHRCQSWGYADAEGLGTVHSVCVSYGDCGLFTCCRREKQEQKFACVDDAE